MKTRQTRLQELEAIWEPPEQEIVVQVVYTDSLTGEVELGPTYTYRRDPAQGWRRKGGDDAES